MYEKENMRADQINKILEQYLIEIISIVNKGNKTNVENFTYNFFADGRYSAGDIILEELKNYLTLVVNGNRSNPMVMQYYQLKISLEDFINAKTLYNHNRFVDYSVRILNKIKGSICDDCNKFCSQLCRF